MEDNCPPAAGCEGNSDSSSSRREQDMNLLQQQAARRNYRPKLGILPLVALTIYEVSGGPFGVEDSVKAAGPLLALLGFLVFPFIWSIPEALVTAELATAFPENGGYVLWISAAFGPFWGFQEGWWKWISGVADNALYPILFLNYLKYAVPVFGGGPIQLLALLLLTIALTCLNCRGLTIVGFTAVTLTIFSLLPFFVMAILAVPKIKVKRWLVVDMSHLDWQMYLNILFWIPNYWDSVSTLAGEVENPSQTFPKALLWAVVLVILSYVIPLAAGTGALELDRQKWEDGYFADVGMAIGGVWLKWSIEAAAALSNMSLFEAEMTSNSFQLLSMAEMGLLPKVFAIRTKYGTLLVGIICSASGIVLLSWMSFQEIVEFLNYLYCFGMLVEFVAFVWLHTKQPELEHPFQIPVGTFSVILMLLPPTILLLLVMYIASWKTVVFSITVSIIGTLVYLALKYAKAKKWLQFVDTDQPSRLHHHDYDDDVAATFSMSLHHEVLEAEARLLSA
ncbi:unnamed protein product [Sphagnum balticum]